MFRPILVTLLALALTISAGGTARAEGDEESGADPGTELFRQALADYRTALAELRELCQAGADEDEGVTTARRRAPKGPSACQRGMKELKAFLIEVRNTAHWLRRQHAEEREARRIAKEEERAAKERERALREDEERKAADRAEKAKRDEAAKQAEKARQQEKDKQKAANDAGKQRAAHESELALYRKKAQHELAEWAADERAASEYRALAASKTGEERARYEQKALIAAAQAAEHQALALRYQAKVAELERTVASLPQNTDVAKKAQKLRDQLRSVEDTLAYKRGLEQDALDRAAEYRAVAAERTGLERDKYLGKAAELERQAAEWGRLVGEYEAQRDRLQAELDALGV